MSCYAGLITRVTLTAIGSLAGNDSISASSKTSSRCFSFSGVIASSFPGGEAAGFAGSLDVEGMACSWSEINLISTMRAGRQADCSAAHTMRNGTALAAINTLPEETMEKPAPIPAFDLYSFPTFLDLTHIN